METIREAHAAARHDTSRRATAGEYLTFRLGAEEYGVDILRVQEIRPYEPPTRMAHAAACVRGVINLRGDIVPVLDLRMLLGCEIAHCDSFTAVIVFNLGERVVGAVVDSVSDVLQVDSAALKPPPQLRTSVGGDCITGIGCVDSGAAERMLILIDIDVLVDGTAPGAAPGVAAGVFGARVGH